MASTAQSWPNHAEANHAQMSGRKCCRSMPSKTMTRCFTTRQKNRPRRLGSQCSKSKSCALLIRSRSSSRRSIVCSSTLAWALSSAISANSCFCASISMRVCSSCSRSRSWRLCRSASRSNCCASRSCSSATLLAASTSARSSASATAIRISSSCSRNFSAACSWSRRQLSISASKSLRCSIKTAAQPCSTTSSHCSGAALRSGDASPTSGGSPSSRRSS
mmetsp:Transcript_84607/g.236077  ORF Transcript_84607/g.236077 Transcript_84607/m.236077 type:complete len:220 (-) Transcript_84607:127-786(-)